MSGPLFQLGVIIGAYPLEIVRASLAVRLPEIDSLRLTPRAKITASAVMQMQAQHARAAHHDPFLVVTFCSSPKLPDARAPRSSLPP